MFVGEVRCATTGCGSSWKLSGGRPASAGPTKVSKNLQVRRAVARSVLASWGASRGVDEAPGGRLTHRAARGDSAHSSRNGAATAALPGRATATTIPAVTARTSAPRMRRYTPVISRDMSDLAWAAVVH